ncbi:MAG: hypothetical protein GY822_10290, partial [Deltaproteobacteria bacterium]|nr:hypothetical protein [Deltaproteobacteria bacterium]
AAWIHVAPKKTLASSPQKKATAPTKPSIDKKPKSGPEAKHTSIAAAKNTSDDQNETINSFIAFEKPETLFALRETVLYAESDFSAKALQIIAKDAPIEIIGKQSQGVWLKAKIENQEGWVNTFHLVTAVSVKGGETQVKKVPDWTQGAGTFQKKKKEVAVFASKNGPDGIKDASAKDEVSKNNVVGVGTVNRQMELSLEVGVAGFLQDYRSDSQNDPFHAYLLQSMGGVFHGAFAYRSDSPFVFTSSLDVGMSGVPFAPIEGLIEEDTLAFFIPVQMEMAFGWRVLENDVVDVELGLGLRTQFLPWLGFEETPEKLGMQNALPSTLFLGLIPRVRAFSRLGALGLLSMEATLGVGTSLFFPDPGYTFLFPAGGAGPPVPIIPGDDQDVPIEGAAAGNLGISVQGTLGYLLPITETFMWSFSSSLRVLQTNTSGAGTRTGTYTYASQMDVSASVHTGPIFGF